jgi:hypothetical protein
MDFEALYDVPATEVVLSGGPHSGKRFLVPDDRDTWLMPTAPPLPTLGQVMDVTWGFASLPTVLDQVVTYRFTGSITDEGLRVFRAS